MFPTPSEEGEMIKSTWNRANEATSQEVPIALTPVIAKVVCINNIIVEVIFLLFSLDFGTQQPDQERSQIASFRLCGDSLWLQ